MYTRARNLKVEIKSLKEALLADDSTAEHLRHINTLLNFVLNDASALADGVVAKEDLEVLPTRNIKAA